MSVFGKSLAVAVSAVALSGAALAPLGFALAAGSAEAHQVSQPMQVASATPTPSASQSVDAELTCLAKVVVHEAGNQSRDGQLAVAQGVMNRVNDSRGRFGRTICGVVMQRGQFFNVHAYNPPRNARWRMAVEVAREARDGSSDQVMDGALFFHAAYANMSFRGRTRIGRLGGHVFYR